MINRKFVKSIMAICLYFSLYFLATAFESKFWGDVLTPVGALLSFGILLNTYFKADKTQSSSKVWIVLSLSSLSWAIADILWALYDWVLHKNPENSELISLFYLGTTVFLLAAICIYAMYNFKKWNTAQLVMDAIAISTAGLYFVWILVFHKDFKTFNLISSNGWEDIITVAFDVATFVGVIIWFTSIRSKKIPAYLRMIASSLILFCAADLYWIYECYIDRYTPNSIVDAVYMAALLGISIGGLLKGYMDNPNVQEDECSNVGRKHRGTFILLCPVLTILLKGFVLMELVNFLILYILYQSLTGYIQTSIKNEQLLRKQKALNLELEGRIAERTKQLVEKNKQLNFLSNQDTVTNLYNRRYFIYKLDKMLAKISSAETLALLYIDIDRFKTINDTYGHYVGDQVLIEISKRMLALKQKKAIIARIGGDEFVFAIRSNDGYPEIEKIAHQVTNDCDKTIKIGDYSFCLTISIGISIYPLDAENTNMLLRNADIAMYQAKKQGFNRVVSFNQQLRDTIQRKNEIEILLKQLDFDNELMLFYQPQFSIPEKKLIGMEALLRWNSPEKGLIPPDEFIPISEEINTIIPMGSWVMKKAISQIAIWNHFYGLDLKMGINVSPKQLEQIGFIDKMQSFMENCSVKSNWVDVEITEGVAIEGKQHISEIVHQLGNAGVSISIDDFGTGYSSLAYLKMFPFDRIKIAKQLIDSLTTDHYDLSITKSTILLAKSIGIQAIAEGVETKEQFDLLAALGCEQIQGYYLGKPMPPEKFEENFLKSIPASNNCRLTEEICTYGN